MRSRKYHGLGGRQTLPPSDIPDRSIVQVAPSRPLQLENLRPEAALQAAVEEKPKLLRDIERRQSLAARHQERDALKTRVGKAAPARIAQQSQLDEARERAAAHQERLRVELARTDGRALNAEAEDVRELEVRALQDARDAAVEQARAKAQDGAAAYEELLTK